MFRKTKPRQRTNRDVEVLPVLPGQHIYPATETHLKDMSCPCGPIIEPGTYGPAAIHRDEVSRSTAWAGMSVTKARKYVRRTMKNE